MPLDEFAGLEVFMEPLQLWQVFYVGDNKVSANLDVPLSGRPGPQPESDEPLKGGLNEVVEQLLQLGCVYVDRGSGFSGPTQ